MTLVCFPYAGGGATKFASWRRILPDRFSVYAHVAPGREERSDETPLDSVHQLADDVLPGLRRLVGPVVLVGHSFGASIAYEVAQRLIEEGRPPAHLVALAADAPGKAEAPPRDDHDIEMRWKALGVDAAGLSRPEFRQWILPVLRADLTAHAMYRPDTGRASLTTPMAMIYGDEDPLVGVDAAAGWRAACEGPFEVTGVPGGHFFPQESPLAAVSALVRVITRPRSAARDAMERVAGDA